MTRTWHPGQPRNEVAIQATEPWEKWPHLFGSVFRDPQDGLFKMYYESAIVPSLKPPNSFTNYICDEQGKPYPGFDLTDCDRLEGDVVSRTVSWKGQDDVSAFAGKPVRLQFEMSRCQLWSFQFQG